MSEQMVNRYMAVPASGRGAGVLVLHPWWGLNDFIRSFCDRLAQAGFVALAPDLFAGKLADTVEGAEQLVQNQVDHTVIPAILISSLEALRQHPAIEGQQVGVVGFSFGAFWALWLSQQAPGEVRAVTVFYGTDGESVDFNASNAAYLGHFAENDPYEPAEGVQALEASLKSAGRSASLYTYPGTGHWFVETDRAGAYNPQAAQLAWQRTVEFLRQQFAA